MKLPERMYYPLPEAAEKLGCTIKDIYHFAYIGVIDVSVFIPSYKNDKLLIMLPSELINEIDNDFGGVLGTDKWSLFDIELRQENEMTGYYAKSISGFFYVWRDSFALAEFTSGIDVIKTPSLTTKPEAEGGEVEIASMQGGIELDSRYLCIMASDLEKIKDVGSLPIKKIETPKTIAKKGEIISALIKMNPELSDIDLDITPVAKVIMIIEAAAASRGVELPPTDKNTWAKYLGRK
ncbi:hypothetical protein WCD93_25905 [Klebsiella michiganensis]|uniref:hypothetical protein n=1 Tax=Klebsiella TaxID=570 RepID=UPI0034D66107|nr:hypothetical protein [Klebsiella pneumoniae]HCA3667204.1 hypothetical protein [Klebsiella pneumoniae]HCC6463621.1 hypothetical protein [Klebsiella pneumoniae]HCM1778959.1 hypothetical protein [Klebsiella pneumoniae]